MDKKNTKISKKEDRIFKIIGIIVLLAYESFAIYATYRIGSILLKEEWNSFLCNHPFGKVFIVIETIMVFVIGIRAFNFCWFEE